MDAMTLAAACESTERIVEGISEEHYGLATPCDDWDVRALLNHLLGTLSLGHALLTDTEPEITAGPGELPAEDLVGDDPLKAYRSHVEHLLAVATPAALTQAHTTPFGEMPGAVLNGFTTVDIAVHGWDLAKATGQDPALDDDLAVDVLAFAHQTLTPEMRAPRIGPEVAVDASASPTDQLVAFLGRTP